MNYPKACFSGFEVVDLRERYPFQPGMRHDTRPLSAIKRLVVHHSATRTPVEDGTNGPSVALIDGIDRWHKENNGWPAVGYHFCIDGDGTVFWVNGLQLVSYHSGPANQDSIGLCWLGNYENSRPPRAMVTMTAALLVALSQGLGRELELVGHQDVMRTTCPTRYWPPVRKDILELATPRPAPGLVPQSIRDAAESHLHVLWALDERTHAGVIQVKRDLQFPD